MTVPKQRIHAVVPCQVTGLGNKLFWDIRWGTEGTHGFWLVPGACVSLLSTMSGGIGTRVRRTEENARRERLPDRSPAQSAKRCGRLLNPFAFARVFCGGRGFWKDAREALQAEASMRQVTDVVLCPYKEPCSLGALSTPQKGAETAKGSRSFGPRKSKWPCRHPSMSLKLYGHYRPGGLWSIHLRSFEECTF